MENNRPFEILSPYERWVPTREQLVQSEYEKLQGNNGAGILMTWNRGKSISHYMSNKRILKKIAGV